MGKYLDYTGLSYLWSKLKAYFVSRLEHEEDEEIVARAINYLDEKIDNTSYNISNINEEISDINEEISDINEEISDINEEIGNIPTTLDDLPDGNNRKLSTLAPKNSPSFTGTPIVQTPPYYDLSTRIANTLYVRTITNELSNSISSCYDELYNLNTLISNINSIVNNISNTNLSSTPVYLHQKINGLSVYGVYIPIDPDEVSLSDSCVTIYINGNTKYLQIEKGGILSENAVITQSIILGNGILDYPSIVETQNNIVLVYSILPIENIKDLLQYLFISYYTSLPSNAATSIWIENFKHMNTCLHFARGNGNTTWEEFIDSLSPISNYGYDGNNPNIYIYSPSGHDLSTYVWNNNTYYLWENEDNSFIILTDTIDVQFLLSKSLKTNPNNKYCPYVAILLGNDEEYSASDRTKDWLIAVEQHWQYNDDITMFIDDFEDKDPILHWIDDFSEYSYDSWEDNISTALADPGRSGAFKYDLLEEYTWNNNAYYLWECQNRQELSYILTSTCDYNELYLVSLENDEYNLSDVVIKGFDADMQEYNLANKGCISILKVIE